VKADAFEVGSILRQRQRFEVPVYQRHYAWAEERLEPFWEDIRAKADERLDSKPLRFAHYMGALLVMPEGGYQVGRVPTFNIVFNGEPGQNKQEFLRSSLLKMNQEIANCAMWDEAAIERRAERLAMLASELWQTPAAAEATTTASTVAAE
jgi:hypothetical protein